MEKTRIEPGLLPMFRFFIGFLGATDLLVAIGLVMKRGMSHHPAVAVWFTLIANVSLLIYLSIPWLQRLFGRLYLPLALLGASVIPLFDQFLIFHSMQEVTPAVYNEFSWQVILFLFFPLVLISWQYNFWSVLAFSFGTFSLDVVFLHILHLDQVIDNTNFGRAMFGRTFTFLIVGYVITRLVKRQRRQHRELVQANAKLSHYAATLEQLTISRERNRMARELHDIMAHTLSGVAVQLEAVKAIWEREPDKARGMLDQSLDDTRHGLQETRNAIQALRATPLEDLGLPLAIQSQAEAVANRVGFDLTLRLSPQVKNLPPDLEQCFYRVTQEALENIAKHSGAGHVTIELRRVDGRVTLSISDDGCGFDPDLVDADQHFGLRGIRERVEMMGGTFAVVSDRDEGTTVRISVEQGAA
jgi:signal transduction histidine kinase